MKEQMNTNPHDFVHEQLSIAELRRSIQGRVIIPSDTGYDEARAVFYGSFDRRPSVIIQPHNTADIAHVVALARTTGIELAVRSGGHSLAGHSTTEGGILLDLSSIKRLEIDAQSQTAWAEAGLTAGEYTTAAAEYNLATGFGDTSTVGIGGLTLGGGIGYLVRKYGLTIDNLLAAEIVTADGSTQLIDAHTHPDLFWAIRGGGGNFGVVSRFQFQLHELETIIGGMLIFLATADTIATLIELADAAPDELSMIANLMAAPPLPYLPEEHHGKLIVMAQLVYSGETSKGEQIIAPFRALGPVADLVKTMPYPEIYNLNQIEAGPAQEVVRSFFLDRIDLRMAELIIEHLQATTAPMAVTQLRVLGGAMARIPVEATAFAHRKCRFMVAIGAVYENAEETPQHQAWVTSYAAALDDGTQGAYVNFLGHDAKTRLHDAYPDAVWKRLAAVKAHYDPTNVFRLNYNVLSS